MHDLDRTQQTLEPEGEYGTAELELASEIFGNRATATGELSPEAELGLAHELFAATNEGELEQFVERFTGYYPQMQRRGRYRMRRFFRRYRRSGGYGGYGGGDGGGDGGGMEPPQPPPVTVVEADPDGGEELELSSAQRFVRLGATLAKKLAETPPEASGEGEGENEGEQPGLRLPAVASQPAGTAGAPAQRGHWKRHYGKIVLFGT
jgi:hypothetical protein